MNLPNQSELPSPVIERHRLYVLQASCLLDTPPDATLDRVTELATRLFKAPIALISLIDEKRQWFKARVGVEVAQTERKDAFGAYTILRRDVLVVPDASLDPRFKQNGWVIGEPNIRFYAGSPLRTRSGVSLGSLCVIDTKPRYDFDESQQDLLTQLAEMAMDRIEALRSIAFVDPPTRLLNRARFSDDVRAIFDERRNGQISPSHAVLINVVPLGYLDETSVSVGIVAADRLMAAISVRVERALVDIRPVYRVDYARFAVFVRGGESAAMRVIEAALRAFDAPLVVNQIPVDLSPTVGLVDLSGIDEHTDVLRALMSSSEVARRARVPFRKFAKRMFVAQERTFFILNTLPQALHDEHQLSLVYQPRIDLRTGRCVGVEALLRWSHPLLGDVSPAEFIPLAERTSLMPALTDWVMDNALKQLAAWQKAGISLNMSINVSVLNLEQRGFVIRYASLLQTHGIEPARVELEVTESALAQNARSVTENLRKVTSMGSTIAIDDFGTGYSNLSKLQLYSASVLKIDQSLVRRVLETQHTRILVEGIITLAHKLDYRVVAEGVETPEIYETVADWRCDEAQGYHIAKPLTAAMFESWHSDYMQYII
ncbi:EAL domain-containing protein [Paraburkholderia madseniana]|uniref:putative bifunctional diguanylate cyclase/phosphodiesterase n=1 Tax=Paraburkholderia madseniana TaxID=2599607 RepID=UPI0038B6F091